MGRETSASASGILDCGTPGSLIPAPKSKQFEPPSPSRLSPPPNPPIPLALLSSHSSESACPKSLGQPGRLATIKRSAPPPVTPSNQFPLKSTTPQDLREPDKKTKTEWWPSNVCSILFYFGGYFFGQAGWV